jgi:hypothetical protein
MSAPARGVDRGCHFYNLKTNRVSLFRPRCVASRAVPPLRRGENGRGGRLAAEDACKHDMLVLVRWQGRNVAVPVSQLAAIDPGESTAEAIGDWHY